jgi:hypothetical protein
MVGLRGQQEVSKCNHLFIIYLYHIMSVRHFTTVGLRNVTNSTLHLKRSLLLVSNDVLTK